MSLAGSVGLLIQDALVDSAASSWTGVAGILQCVFILARYAFRMYHLISRAQSQLSLFAFLLFEHAAE